MLDWKGNTVIYTAVSGDFEHLGPQVFEDGVDYIFFSDYMLPIESRWQIEPLSFFSHLHPRRAAKIPKLAPHEFNVLTKYKYAIWIDGDMQIMQPFVEEMLSYMDDGMVLSPHFDGRRCAYGEAQIIPPKYVKEPIDAQVQFYRKEGFPTEYGLYEGGMIARDMQHDQVRELGYRWMLQNMILSYQDQISLPYCLWKMDYHPGILPKSFREFNWVWINAHKSEA